MAADGRRGVYAVLRGKILRGTNVLKVHSTALDAFVSVNEPLAGRIENGKVLWTRPNPPKLRRASSPKSTRTFSFCGSRPTCRPRFSACSAAFRTLSSKPSAAAVSRRTWSRRCTRSSRAARAFWLTTQCIEGGVHLHKYEVGRRAEAMGAVSLGMRTAEDALAAVMCGEV